MGKNIIILSVLLLFIAGCQPLTGVGVNDMGRSFCKENDMQWYGGDSLGHVQCIDAGGDCQDFCVTKLGLDCIDSGIYCPSKRHVGRLVNFNGEII